MNGITAEGHIVEVTSILKASVRRYFSLSIEDAITQEKNIQGVAVIACLLTLPVVIGTTVPSALV
jgi:hypothetical protein